MLGRDVVARLQAKGETVRVMSRSPKPSNVANLEWAQADLETGAGLAEAVRGVDVIVHAASNSRKDTMKIDVEGTQQLLQLAQAAGIRYFLYISIVGIENVDFSYYKAKLAAENVIKQSNVPWAILRATQFHPFIDLLLTMFTPLPIAFLPTDWKSQPIDVSEVATRITEVVETKPLGMLPDIAGPEVLTFGEMARSLMKARGIRKPIIHLPFPGKMSAGIRKGGVTNPSARYGKITWAQYLERTYSQADAGAKRRDLPASYQLR